MMTLFGWRAWGGAWARLLTLTLLLPGVVPINPLVIRGNMLYDSVTQERVFLRGVTYNPHPQLSGVPAGADLFGADHDHLWQPALDNMVAMNVNAVRLYDIDVTVNHAAFMHACAARGIYVQVPVTGVNMGKLDAKRGSPWCYYDTVPGYGGNRPLGQVLVEYGRSIIKEFSGYDNTLAFTVGNEVFLQSTVGYTCIPCLKAYVRDLHLYQADCKHAMRAVPLVYASEDTQAAVTVAEYLTCVGREAKAAGNEFDKVDMLGINTYAYCSDSVAFPYQDVLRSFSTYDVPMYFTEFGCNQGDFLQGYPYQVGGRGFKQVAFMMSNMKDSFSGGMVYEYSMHSNGYGLVYNLDYDTSVGELTSGARNLAIAYAASPPYAPYAGDWDDATRCEWRPPTSVAHVARTCPLSPPSTNWLEDLPVTPPCSVTCPGEPAGGLSALARRENGCFFDLPVTQVPSGLPTREPTHEPTPRPSHAPTPWGTGAPTPMPHAKGGAVSTGAVEGVWVGATAAVVLLIAAALAVDKWGLPGEQAAARGGVKHQRRHRRNAAAAAGGPGSGTDGGLVAAVQRYLFGAEPEDGGGGVEMDHAGAGDGRDGTPPRAHRPPKNFPAAKLPVVEVQLSAQIGSPIHGVDEGAEPMSGADRRAMDSYRC